MADTSQRKCGSCGQVGHNKRTCKNSPAKKENSSELVIYAVLTQETTKDWKKPTQIEKLFRTLEGAVAHINKSIKEYIDDYDLLEEFDNKIPTVSIDDLKGHNLQREPHQLINLKPPSEDEDDEEDGMWGNIRFFVQEMKLSD